MAPPKKPGLRRQPDVVAMAEATRAFLIAAGMNEDDPDLAGTGERVAAAWRDDLLDGYQLHPQEVLESTLRAASEEPIAVRDISFHSMCPHHLLPFTGRAHIVYVPRERIVGFSQIVRLVDCLAHRLTLQERITKDVVDALVEHVGAKAAACALQAEQSCVTLRGVRRVGTRVWTEATAGDSAWFQRLIELIGHPERPPTR